MKKSFNKEELTIMSFYNCTDRIELINKLESVAVNLEKVAVSEDEIEAEAEVREIIIKLKSISDSDFKYIDLKDILEIEE